MASRNASEMHASNNGGEDETNNDNEHTPVAKKLKSSPTDLVIRIGEEKYEYHCHSMVMAHSSVFIDTALASPMQECQTRIIDLPDVSPRIWNLMMQFINSPPTEERWKDLPIHDIVSVAEKFDEYEFPNGSAICGMHISRFYESARKTIAMDSAEPINSSTMSVLIKCALRCNQIQLNGTMPKILSFFRRALALPKEVGNHCGGLIFKTEQLQELAPLIADNDLLGDSWAKEEIRCPLFPKHFLTTLLIEYEKKRFGPMYRRESMRGILNLELTLRGKTERSIAMFKNGPVTQGTPSYVGRVLPARRGSSRVSWGGGLHGARLLLQKRPDQNWAIVVPAAGGDNEAADDNFHVLWYSPLSFNCVNFPPMKPWVKAHDDAPEGCVRIVPETQRSYEENMMGLHGNIAF